MPIGLIFERMGALWATFIAEPLVYFPIIIEWLFAVLYFSISADKEGRADVCVAGITLGVVGFELFPFNNINFHQTIVWLALGFIGYGILMFFLVTTDALSNTTTKIFGMPAIIALPTLLAILHWNSNVPVDWLTFGIIGTPIMIVETIKFIKQYLGEYKPV